MGTFDAEGEFQRGMALFEETIETLTLALGWKVNESIKVSILEQLKGIQANLMDEPPTKKPARSPSPGM